MEKSLIGGVLQIGFNILTRHWLLCVLFFSIFSSLIRELPRFVCIDDTLDWYKINKICNIL